AIAAIFYARNQYVTKGYLPSDDEKALPALQKAVANKFYVDEIYDKIFVKPIQVLSDLFLVLVDKLIIDLLVNATAWFVGLTGRTLRLLQTGNTGFYIFAMVSGMIILLLIRLFI
ncbi:MAG: NADH-quinone oxidoreductase subunit L, partial [Bacteroidota bacterium]